MTQPSSQPAGRQAGKQPASDNTRTSGAARGEFVSGADHMGANEAVPTIWDPDLEFFVRSKKTYSKSIFGKKFSMEQIQTWDPIISSPTL